MADRFDQPDVEDMQDYIEGRASLLNKVFTDHVIWEQSLEAFGRDTSLAATWIDHQGEEHVLRHQPGLSRCPFQDRPLPVGRPRGMRTAGNVAIQSIVALHAEMLGEDEAG